MTPIQRYFGASSQLINYNTLEGRTQRRQKDEGRIGTKRNNFKKSIAEKMYGLRPNFTSIETDYYRMSFFFTLFFEIRETRFEFFL